MSALADHVGGRLRNIGLEELNARAALQTRVDSKYLVRLAAFEQFIERVADRCDVLNVEGSVGQQYDTIYFDSPELICFRDHLQRRRQTYKLRSRVYVGSGLHVFEVKMRDGRGHTVKKKIDHSDEHPAVIGDEATTFYRETISTMYGFDVTHPTRPSMRNQYSRITLASRHGQERTTVDFDLRILDLAGADPMDGRVAGGMASGIVLVETKSAHGSGEMDRVLWALGARPRRVSKYCIGIALLHPQFPTNRYTLSTACSHGPHPRRSLLRAGWSPRACRGPSSPRSSSRDLPGRLVHRVRCVRSDHPGRCGDLSRSPASRQGA